MEFKHGYYLNPANVYISLSQTTILKNITYHIYMAKCASRIQVQTYSIV